jgi:hypothetical protein
MEHQDFTTTIIVDKTPSEAFRAINYVRGWWGKGIEGKSDSLNDEFVFQVEGIHHSKQKVVELIPGKRVVWKVTDSTLDFVKDKSEWTGTTISFDITKQDDKTEVRFTHAGLVPDIECYGRCSNAWTSIVNESLYGLINTGKDQPMFG